MCAVCTCAYVCAVEFIPTFKVVIVVGCAVCACAVACALEFIPTFKVVIVVVMCRVVGMGRFVFVDIVSFLFFLAYLLDAIVLLHVLPLGRSLFVTWF